MSHPWISHVSHMNETHIQRFIITIKAIKPQELARTLWNHVHNPSRKNGSCLAHEWVTSHIWMRHTHPVFVYHWKAIKPTESTHSFRNHILEFWSPISPNWHRRLPPLHFETLQIRWSKFVHDSSCNMENIENNAYRFSNVRRCHVVKWVLWNFKIRGSKFVDVSSRNTKKIVYCFNDVRRWHVVKWVLWFWSCSKVGVVVWIRLSSNFINCAEPRATWLIRMLRHTSFTCETWLIHTWDMTHSYVETQLIHVWDLTHSHMRHDSFVWYVKTQFLQMWDTTMFRQDSFTRGTLRVHVKKRNKNRRVSKCYSRLS